MAESSKLARQLAYKKKLEEEYRLAEERRQAGKIRRYSGYQIREYEARSWEENERHNRFNEDEKENIKDDKKHLEKEQMDMKKERSKGIIEKSQRKKSEYFARAAMFSDIKKRRLCEKRMLEESRKKCLTEDHNLLADLEDIIHENKVAMKGLEEYKRLLEIKDNEEKMKHELEKGLIIAIQESIQKENKSVSSKISEGGEISKTEEQIKELDLLISSVYYDLENIKIDTEHEWLWGVGLLGADL